MKKVFFLIMLSFLLLGTGVNKVWAEGEGKKAVKGAANTAFGAVTEVFQSPAVEIKNHGPLGLLSGLALIPFKAVVRTVGGLGDLLTSLAGGESMVQDYPLEKMIFP